MIQVPELQQLIQVLELLPISRWAIATVGTFLIYLKIHNCLAQNE